MSTLTGKDLNLVKPALTDDHNVTIGTDLPANFQKIDDEVSAHLADDVTQGGTPHGMNYEEGTFTPEFKSSTQGDLSYSIQSGSYTMIGDRIFFEIRLKVSAVNTQPMGALTIDGLPFPTKNVSGRRYAYTIAQIQNMNFDLS